MPLPQGKLTVIANDVGKIVLEGTAEDGTFFSFDVDAEMAEKLAKHLLDKVAWLREHVLTSEAPKDVPQSVLNDCIGGNATTTQASPLHDDEGQRRRIVCRFCNKKIATLDAGKTWWHAESGRSACRLDDLHASTKAEPR